MHKLGESSPCFTKRFDVTGHISLTPLQKCTTVVCLLAYDMASLDRGVWIFWYVREHRLYALVVDELSSRLVGPIY
jgi:hypothetical protein